MLISVSEDNGTVTVNLIKTGDLSENITVCIRVTMLVDLAMVQRMYTLICRIIA